MRKKIKSKFLSAIFLGLLAISGGFLAIPMLSADNQQVQMQENMKVFGQNPERFLQTENLGLKDGFQYPIGESFVNIPIEETNSAVNEGALETAIEEGDYEAWKEALQEMDGFPEDVGIIDKEDFDVLVALHKSEFSEESEKTE
jgi:hypothetical protein